MLQVKPDLSKAIVWILILSPGVRIPLQLFTQSSFTQILLSTGRSLGSIGLTALAFSIILGTRTQWTENFLGPLVKVYQFHHNVGIVAWFALFVHLLGISAQFFAINFRATVDFWLNWSDWIVASGWVSFLLLSLVFAFSYAKHLHHPIWKRIHQISWGALFAGLAHQILVFDPHSWFFTHLIVIAVTLSAIILVMLKLLFPGVVTQRRIVEVSSIKKLSTDVVEIALKPLVRPIHFHPGQWGYISFNCKKGCGVSLEPHPFTIASIPLDPVLKIIVKAIGDDTSKLQRVALETTATFEGPYGRLFYRLKDAESQLWIAGGIGIAPFLSYLRHIRGHSKAYDIVLLILVKRRQENLFEEELRDLQRAIVGLRVLIHEDEKEGLFSLRSLDQVTSSWRERTFIIAGPSRMALQFAEELRKLGINSHKIRTEAFAFL